MPKAKSTHLTSADLLKQSEALRRQAEELKRKETPEVVARIKEAIAHYGLTAQDLGLAGKAPTRPSLPRRSDRLARRQPRHRPSSSIATTRATPGRAAGRNRSGSRTPWLLARRRSH